MGWIQNTQRAVRITKEKIETKEEKRRTLLLDVCDINLTKIALFMSNIWHKLTIHSPSL